MANSKTNPEEKMEKLAAVVKRGWAKKHPVTEEQKQAVVKVVREQWERIQSGTSKSPAPSKKSPRRQREGPELGRS